MKNSIRFQYLLFVLVWIILSSAVAGKLRATTSHPHGESLHRRALGKSLQKKDGQRQRFLNAPNSGKVNILVLLVRFADHEDRSDSLAPREYWDDMCNGEIRDYFLQQSYGAYDITCMVQDWVTVPMTEAEAAGGNSGRWDTLKASKFFEPALDGLAANADGDDFFFQFDSNGDGFLDNVVVIHSGFTSSGGGGNECGNGPRNRLQSQAHTGSTSLFSEAWADPDWELQLSAYVIATAWKTTCNFENPAGKGVIAHEWVHTFGPLSIDTYDSSTGNYGGLAAWDLMAFTQGGSMSPFSKAMAGWLTYDDISTDGTYTIQPSNTAENIYAISEGFPEGEYLVIENRQPTSFDQDLFDDEGGLLIYHCDDTVDDFGIKGFPGQDGWPANGNHYKCALLQADGNYDLEQGANKGDAGDLWMPGATLGPGNGGQVYPNTDAYQDGKIKETGITITNIENVGSGVMRFSVVGLSSDPGQSVPAPETPAPVPATPSPTQQPTPAPVPETSSPTSVKPGEPVTSPPDPVPESTREPTQSPTRAPTPSPTKAPTRNPKDDDSSLQPRSSDGPSDTFAIALFVAATAILFTLVAVSCLWNHIPTCSSRGGK